MKRPARIPRYVTPIPDKDAYRKAPDHLELVKKLPCSVNGCGRGEIDPHHLMKPEGVFRGGMKSEDRYTIPLCRWHHTLGPEAVHRKGSGDYEGYLMKAWNIPGRELADALWAVRGDLEAMERVAFRFRQAAAMKLRALPTA